MKWKEASPSDRRINRPTWLISHTRTLLLGLTLATTTGILSLHSQEESGPIPDPPTPTLTPTPTPAPTLTPTPTSPTMEPEHAISGGEVEAKPEESDWLEDAEEVDAKQSVEAAPSVEALSAQDEKIQPDALTPESTTEEAAEEATEVAIEELGDASTDAAQRQTVQNYVGNIINSPYLSTKCRSLLRKRQTRLALKQEAVGLQKRIENLRTQAKERQASLLQKLEYIDKSLARKVTLFQEEITNMNEEIVKKGCPGVTL